MSLLCVTIKKAVLQGQTDEGLQSYVAVKLQSVKSTTVAVRGQNPSFEQEFIFETNRLDHGLILELWTKGVLWDKLLGVHFISLHNVQYSAGPGSGKWVQIDQDLETRNGTPVGSSKPTGHSLLVDVRLELPFDQTQSANAAEIQSRLNSLNQIIENKNNSRAPFNHSGLSEDSDYKSDLGVPSQHQYNQSAHQFDSHLHPTSRSNFNYPNGGIGTLNNRFDEEEGLAHESQLRSASGSFQPYQGDYNAYNSPYPIDESPHRLRRHYDFTNGDDYNLPNGHLVGADYEDQSSAYDAYAYNMHPHSTTSNDPSHNCFDVPERRYDIVDEEEEEEAHDGIVYSVYPSSMEHTSAEEYGGTNASYTDVSLQRYQHQDREQTPDYDTGASRPTTANYVLENGEVNQDIYDEYSQYDQTNNFRYDNYTSPPIAPDNYDVDMEDFGSPGAMNTRQATPQQNAYPSSPRSASGLRRVYDSGPNGYNLDYASENYQSDDHGSQGQFNPGSRYIGSAASNSSGTAVVSLSEAAIRCGSTASNFIDIDPVDAEKYAAQLAAAGRRYDSCPRDVLSPVMDLTGSEGAIIENNDAYEDYDIQRNQQFDDDPLSYNSRPMTHSDSTYRQYTQALEEEHQQQTMPNGVLLNGFAGGVTPTNVSMFQNDALALRSAYEKEEEEQQSQFDEQQQSIYDQQPNEYSAQYEQYSQYDQIPEQAYIPPENEPTTSEQPHEWNQAPPPQTPAVQISEVRDYRKLWKWAYKEACKSRGITVEFV